ncbi:M3 family metallopeptidase [uncultured Jatrophihabitans sp.]|uniref:M3 family metallopeptidase n=1 Tax=uncultured Jatrophihabitans sp. TaxID=1610747 RepID=UPI0035CC3A41
MTQLDALALPQDGWPDWLAGRVDDLLATAQELLGRLKDGSSRSADEVLELWNDADIALRGASSVSSLLNEVHPEAEVRTLAEDRAQDVSRVATDRDLDRELFEVLDSTDPSGLDEQAVRLREKVLRDFRRTGVDRSEGERTRLREIAERLTVVDQDFARNIRDDVRSISLTPDRLVGVPQDWIDAHPPGDDGLVTVTTDYPDYLPFRAFAADAAARRELANAFLNLGWPVNDEILHEMLDLRHEQATLLGYPDWPSYDAEVKMVASSQHIADFIAKVADAAADAGRRDVDTLLERRRQDEPDATGMDATCAGYYSELVRREHFDVDAQLTRQYFQFDRVRQGLLEVTGALFDVEYVRIPDASVWHEDVAAYDVLVDGVRKGRIYLDLHPRENKFKHAAQFDLVAGVTDRQLPEGVLVCNFSRTLMEHSDVVTLFHEFGHLVHHVLGGDQHWARFSGVATEWDFVEAPSQMLEEWAWDADILRTFATDADGNPIPRELVERMRAAKEFGKGLFVRTQLFYTAVSYEFHRDRPADLTARLRELQAKYDMLAYIDDTHFHAAFGHLAGYSSGYYTYMWSLVIAKDLFAQFDAADLLQPEVAHRYRDKILVPGGSRDAADLVAAFLGRPFSFDAYAAWLDREATMRSSTG